MTALTTVLEDVAKSAPKSASIAIDVQRVGTAVEIVVGVDVPLWSTDESDAFRPFFRREVKHGGLAYAIARALVVANGGAVGAQIRGDRTEIAMVFPSREDR